MTALNHCFDTQLNNQGNVNMKDWMI